MCRESLLVWLGGLTLVGSLGPASGMVGSGAAEPPAYSRVFADTFDRAPTTSKPGGAGLGPLWDESPPHVGPYIASEGDRAYCPQASTMVFVSSLPATRGDYAEGLFRWAAPWSGGGLRFHLDAAARIQSDGRHYLVKYRHEPEFGVTPRIVLYRAGIGGSKQFWGERVLPDYPPLDTSPRWLRVAVMDDAREDPVVTGAVAWGGPTCGENGTLEDCQHMQSFTMVDAGDPLGLSGTGGRVFLSVHHSDYELLQFNAGRAGDTLISAGEAVRAGPGTLRVAVSIDPLDGMTAAELDVAYDALRFVATAVEPTALLDGYSLGCDLSTPGWIHITLSSSESGCGSGEALWLSFAALAPGCTLVDLAQARLNEGTLPSSSSDGHLLAESVEDADGDGISEVSGDCCDRFDWIHPGATERCNGADDDCDGQRDEDGVCACPSFPCPRGPGFWETACRGSNPEVSLGPSHVGSVSDTATFAGLDAVEPICDRLLGQAATICGDAEQAFLALLLNRGDGRLCDLQPISAENTAHLTVGAAIGEVDAILAGPVCDPVEGERALAICQELNNGQGIPDFLAEEEQLWVDSGTERSATLHWDRSDASAAGRTSRFRILRSALGPIEWMTLGTSRCPSWLQDRDCRSAPGSVYLYAVVGDAR